MGESIGASKCAMMGEDWSGGGGGGGCDSGAGAIPGSDMTRDYFKRILSYTMLSYTTLSYTILSYIIKFKYYLIFHFSFFGILIIFGGWGIFLILRLLTLLRNVRDSESCMFLAEELGFTTSIIAAPTVYVFYSRTLR